MGTTEPQVTTATKLKRIAWLSARDRTKQLDCLMHLFNEESLAGCFHSLDGRKAVGADGVTKAEYGRDLDRNLENLVERMKRMAYRPGPVQRVLIPKDDKPDATRPLGIGNLEDKVVQGMMHRILNAIYEPLFLDCSYGFRPGRSCHDALRALYQHVDHHPVETVIDVDLASYFDSIDHNILLEMLSEKINDRRFLRYVSRMFKAGVLAQGECTVSDEGVPQGSLCSPVLANVFAHHVIDEWFEGTVKRHCAGQVTLYRYCDDFVICCQYERDALRIRKALGQRLAKYNLALNEEKTRLVPFARPREGRGRPGTFDFLGLTFYWGKSRRGNRIPKVKTSGTRLRVKLKRVNAWAREMRSRHPLKWIWKTFCAKLRGHVQYYGMSFNGQRVMAFIWQATRLLFKWLNRRSQRRSFTWAQFTLFMKLNPLPKPAIAHSLY